MFMLNRIFLIIGLLTLLPWQSAGCRKDTSRLDAPLSIPKDRTDALWQLAPADTAIGVVVAGGSGAMLATAWGELEIGLAEWSDFTAMAAELRAELPAEVFDAEARARMGLDLARDAAVFRTAAGTFMAVLPVADRQAFRTRMGKRVAVTTEEVDGVAFDIFGTEMRCRELDERYLCASDMALLAAAGASDAVAKGIAERPDTLRGHIEALVQPAFLAEHAPVELGRFYSDIGGLDAAVQLSTGTFTARAHLRAKATHPRVGALIEIPDTLAQRAVSGEPTGIWRLRVDIKPLLGDSLTQILTPVADKVGFDPQADVIDNLTGELILSSPKGDADLVVLELGARDGNRLQPLVPMLCIVAHKRLPLVPGLGGQQERCTSRLYPGSLGGELATALSEPLEIALDTTADTLRLRMALPNGSQGKPVDLGPVGRELLTDRWNWAVYGSGHMLADQRKAPLSPRHDLENKLVKSWVWLLMQLHSVGVGIAQRDDGVHALMHVGSQWSNPEPVRTTYQDAINRLLSGEDEEFGAIAELAEEHPDTPFGRSYRAGAIGMMMFAGTVGLATSVGIPEFLQYQQEAQRIEAE